MIDFAIDELEVDEESAREIRLDPGSFLIGYETFKVLAHK